MTDRLFVKNGRYKVIKYNDIYHQLFIVNKATLVIFVFKFSRIRFTGFSERFSYSERAIQVINILHLKCIRIFNQEKTRSASVFALVLILLVDTG